jgi:CpeT/CpcT family (DUF1001)
MGSNGDDKNNDDDDDDDDDGSLMLATVMMEHFQGDFDNYNQVVLDRQDGRLPREGGGHEHIHCTLIPLSHPNARLAAFYFDGLPQRIFRFRYYQLQPPQWVDSKTLTTVIVGDGHPNDENNAPKQIRMEMRLFTLSPELEALLRAQSEDPTVWPCIFDSFVKEKSGSEVSVVTRTIAVDRLPNCEVSWSMDMDPVQHAYVTVNGDARPTDGEEGGGVHAVMVHGEAIVVSTMIPGAKIRVLDQLSLFPNVFYINDRGLDPATGAFIYGNQRNVPYRLDRVTRVVVQDEDRSIRRCIVNADLEWTLGQKWRDVSLYETKMDAIGGPSTRINVN